MQWINPNTIPIVMKEIHNDDDVISEWNCPDPEEASPESENRAQEIPTREVPESLLSPTHGAHRNLHPVSAGSGPASVSGDVTRLDEVVTALKRELEDVVVDLHRTKTKLAALEKEFNISKRVFSKKMEEGEQVKRDVSSLTHSFAKMPTCRMHTGRHCQSVKRTNTSKSDARTTTLKNVAEVGTVKRPDVREFMEGNEEEDDVTPLADVTKLSVTISDDLEQDHASDVHAAEFDIAGEPEVNQDTEMPLTDLSVDVQGTTGE